MDSLDSEKAYKDYISKEEEYDEFLRDYRHQSKSFDDDRADLHYRWRELCQLVDAEQDYMRCFFDKIDAPLEMLDDYRHELKCLLEESETEYQRKVFEIDDKQDRADEECQKQRIIYEDEIEKLRRTYVNASQ